jgi:hypothetical protein
MVFSQERSLGEELKINGSCDLKEFFLYLVYEQDYHIAYEASAIEGIKIDATCALSNKYQTCLHELLSEEFEIIFPTSKELLLRKKTKNNYRLLRGKVIDVENGEALAFAHIIDIENQVLAISDSSGIFALQVPSNKQRVVLECSYVGYPIKTLTLVDNDLNKPLLFAMRAEPILMNVTRVVAPLPLINLNEDHRAITVSSELASTIPSPIGNDLLRSVQLLAGVNATNDQASSLIIRSGKEDQSRVFINDIPLYKAGHYFDVFSIVNDDPIKNMQLYKNNIPLQYGGVTTGILKINIQEPINNPAMIKADINLLTSDLTISSPLGARAGVLFSGRISNTNIAKGGFFNTMAEELGVRNQIISDNTDTRLFLSVVTPNVKFHDLLGSVNYQLSDNTHAQFDYILAGDQMDYTYKNERIIRNRPLEIVDITENVETWKNKGISGQINQLWENGNRSEIHLTLSSFSNDIGTQRIIENRNNQFQFSSAIHNHIEELSLKLNNYIKVANKTLSLGYNFQSLSTENSISIKENKAVNSETETNLHSVYLELPIVATTQHQLIAGFRTSLYDNTDAIKSSPSLTWNYKFKQEAFKIKASVGRLHQFVRSIYFDDAFGRTIETWTLANKQKYPILSSTNLMTGFNWINEVVIIDFELYHRKEDGVIQQFAETKSAPEGEEGAFLVSGKVSNVQGKGRTTGIDIQLKKEVKNYYGLLSYSLSKNEVSYPEVKSGEWIAGPNDRRHEFKFYNAYKIGDFELGLTYIFASGKPYFDPINCEECQGNDYLVQQSYLENYQRVDIGLNYKHNIGILNAEWSVSLYNLFDRDNPGFLQYAYGRKQTGSEPIVEVFGTEVSLLPRTFNLGLRIGFSN